jgi:hypothetical protein
MRFEIALFVILFSINSFGEIPDFLKKWEADPKEASSELPVKWGSVQNLKFSESEITNRDYVDYKDKARLKLCETSNKNGCEQEFQSLEAADDFSTVRQFVGNNLETNILRLDGYRIGAARTTPWSGHYWPYYEGGIGTRYGDNGFPHSESFRSNYRYYQRNYLADLRAIGNLDVLSPAEKYDIISQDSNWTLTKSVWGISKKYYDDYRKVETWMGICHGWAAAAFLVPEPKKSFDVNLPALNRRMRVYPDDIKAIISQLWAQAEISTTLIGGRCNDKRPAKDANGRIISRSCFDANPASWHLVLVNLMGRARQSFVFDATYDYEVWNQPVSTYQVRYFNPNTKVVTDNLNSAIINYADFRRDHYKSHRSANAQSIVGIQLNLSYVVENTPGSVNGTDSSLPRIVHVKYYYDLELDRNKNIIGGEWYQAAHPDILWRPNTRRPLAKFETQGSYWNGNFPMPNDLVVLSRKNSEYAQPTSAIVDQLIDWSSIVRN